MTQLLEPADPSPSVKRRSLHRISGQRSALPWPNERPFKILSIDGGGIRGIFPAALLAQIEADITGGVPAGQYFDMIAGASTGGIIALALGAGLPAHDILELYLRHGGEIFPSPTGIWGAPKRAYQRVRNLWRFRYAAEPLRHRLQELFGDRLLGHSERRLCIPAFDGTYNEVHVFKTPHHPDFQLDWSETLVDVALATAAAPTLFPIFENRGRRFADGGVWANNPTLIALVDALTCFDLPRRSVHVLSLGCGDSDLPFTKGQNHRGGLWDWRAVIDTAIRLQSQGADGLSRALVGSDQVLRISIDGPAANIGIDDFERAKALLPDEALRLAQLNREALERVFDAPISPFEAFHGPRFSSPDLTATDG